MKFGLSKSLAVVAASAVLIAGCGGNTNNAGNTASTGNNNAAAANSTTASSGANGSTNADSGKKLKIVASFYPMVEFSKQVAGDHADVVGLIPSGTEPHDWEPSAKDMVQVQEADVFVYNGIVEGWADDAISSTTNDKRIVVEASKGLALMEGTAEEEEGEEAPADAGPVLDPHVWLDPALAQKEVAAIQAALIQADPANEADYTKNGEAYLAKLQELDDAYKTGLANTKRKGFVTQHAAFGYMAKEYGITQIPIAGLSPEEEPSPEKMAEIVEFAKQNEVKTIFFETLVDPKVAQTIADEIGAKTDVLNPLEGLTEEEISKNLDYIAVMKSNLEGLEKALNE
ncbi:metal ABC transporter substrate-binding protein [Paenibacillus sepulcri]|uniref:Metal ABC transporter substrate-binding protein n=1 Tax=Paenibacillus sepulcri TaxID=359917 RepID=A0ABS7CD22_9BACL|nr:metal ABC transporter substrate-binding protein [Paenibacillus sepulcri]